MNKHTTQMKAGSVNTSAQSIENFLSSTHSVPSTTSQSVTQLAYHEMGERHVHQVDDLEQLEKNIQALSDLRFRLQFMNREIRYLMKV